MRRFGNRQWRTWRNCIPVGLAWLLLASSAAPSLASGPAVGGTVERPVTLAAVTLATPDEPADVGDDSALVESTDLTGCWSGGWLSCSSGHKGPLSAQFCRLSSGDYRVDFRGRFLRVVPFRYSVVLRVVEVEAGVVHLRGQSYLGRLFGTFHYVATATADEFRADYTSCDDHGKFWLKKYHH